MNEPVRRSPEYRVYDAAVPVLLGIVVLVVAFLQEEFNVTWTTLVAAISIGLVSAGLGYLGAFYCFRRLSTDLVAVGHTMKRELIESVRLSVEPSQDLSRFSHGLSAPILMTQEAIGRFEISIECEQIWIVTATLRTDAPDPASPDFDMLPIVRENIREKGMKYVYIVPDTQRNRTKVRTQVLGGLPNEHRALITAHFLSSEEWTRLPYQDGDIAVYNPTRQPPLLPPAIWFEVPHSERQWCALPAMVTDRWIEQLVQLVPGLDAT